MRAQKVNMNELTDEEKMKLAEVFQQVLDMEEVEKEQAMKKEDSDCDKCHSNGICPLVPELEAMNAEPLQCRSFCNQADDKHLAEIVRRVPVTTPILDMQWMASALIDRAYRLGYRDGVVDTYYNFKSRGLKVPSINELENC